MNSETFEIVISEPQNKCSNSIVKTLKQEVQFV